MRYLYLLLLVLSVSCSVDEPIDHYADCVPSIAELDKQPYQGFIELDILPDKISTQKGFVT